MPRAAALIPVLLAAGCLLPAQDPSPGEESPALSAGASRMVFLVLQGSAELSGNATGAANWQVGAHCAEVSYGREPVWLNLTLARGSPIPKGVLVRSEALSGGNDGHVQSVGWYPLAAPFNPGQGRVDVGPAVGPANVYTLFTIENGPEGPSVEGQEIPPGGSREIRREYDVEVYDGSYHVREVLTLHNLGMVDAWVEPAETPCY